MNCPCCKSLQNVVHKTYKEDDSDAIRRRRECVKCRFRWTTLELKVNIPIHMQGRAGGGKEHLVIKR